MRTANDFYSYLLAEPDVGTRGPFDVPGLTSALIASGAVSAALAASLARQSLAAFSFGAAAPEGAAFTDGRPAPEPTDEQIEHLARFSRGPMADFEALGTRRCGAWHVRDQEQRGTCVAFASTAAYELYLCATSNRWLDLSEQYLYWAIKHHGIDGRPDQDGTRFRHAAAALDQYGTCEEHEWPYDGTLIASNIAHDPPPPLAPHAALAWRTRQSAASTAGGPYGNAALLYQALQRHNGVAIALPVFASPDGATNNWATAAAQTYGAVQDPGPNWPARSGHAVLCVGFVPDALEPLGGYFVIRNSWGTRWGQALPDPDYAGPEPGYGQVSATYVDKYLWETCVFG